MMTSYQDTIAGAQKCLADTADMRLVRAVERAVDAGTHEWRPDPSVEGVWGLTCVGALTYADVVVYCSDGDFSVSDDFERSL